MASNAGYLRDGTTDTGSMTFSFDSRGNMTGRNWTDASDGATDIDYAWNEDNRMIEVTNIYGTSPEQVGTEVQFHYDASGRRLLKRGPYDALTVGPEPVRTRYFFNGLTEEVVKVSVPGAHGDGAFEFTSMEDGDEADEWYASGETAAASAGWDDPRRSDVITLFVEPENNHAFTIGDSSANANPEDEPWNSTKRTLSFWYNGEFTQCRVLLTSAAGERWIDYKFTTGTSTASGANVTFYLGTMPTSTWTRFERNVEADYESLSGSAWSNTDGIAAKILGTVLIDDIRISDSLTVEHNTLGPGVIGHILRHTTWDASTLAQTDRWFHYDQVGSVLNESDANGDDVTRHEQDAVGNVMVSWAGGLWDGGASGWHHNTKNSADDLVYMLQRWYTGELGGFASSAPLQPYLEERYTFAESSPTVFSDPTGMYSQSGICTCMPGGLPKKSRLDAVVKSRPNLQEKLRKCIIKQIEDAHIHCGSCTMAESGRPGGNLVPSVTSTYAYAWAPGTVGGVVGGPVRPPSNRIKVCTNGPWSGCGSFDAALVIVHEMAHSCGWLHQGTPGNPYESAPVPGAGGFYACHGF